MAICPTTSSISLLSSTEPHATAGLSGQHLIPLPEPDGLDRFSWWAGWGVSVGIHALLLVWLVWFPPHPQKPTQERAVELAVALVGEPEPRDTRESVATKSLAAPRVVERRSMTVRPTAAPTMSKVVPSVQARPAQRAETRPTVTPRVVQTQARAVRSVSPTAPVLEKRASLTPTVVPQGVRIEPAPGVVAKPERARDRAESNRVTDRPQAPTTAPSEMGRQVVATGVRRMTLNQGTATIESSPARGDAVAVQHRVPGATIVQSTHRVVSHVAGSGVQSRPVRQPTSVGLVGAGEMAQLPRAALMPAVSPKRFSIEEANGQRMFKQIGEGLLFQPSTPKITASQRSGIESTKESILNTVAASPIAEVKTRAGLPAVRRDGPRVQRDYGWLASTIRRRVAEQQMYPIMAKINGWEGKVVVRVVVKEDGHLGPISVQRSSGYAILDEAAQDTVRSIEPLALEHPLGRSSVLFEVPIKFDLED